MKMSVKLLPLPALAALSACATVPTGPSVAVLPGANKNFEQFRDDDVVCQHYANEQVGQTAGQAASDSAAKSAAVSTALGAAAGALFGAATGHPGAGAAKKDRRRSPNTTETDSSDSSSPAKVPRA